MTGKIIQKHKKKKNKELYMIVKVIVHVSTTRKKDFASPRCGDTSITFKLLKRVLININIVCGYLLMKYRA